MPGKRLGKYAYYLIFFVALTTSKHATTQNIWDGYEHLFLPVKQYVAYQTINPISIDGKANEKSWQQAEWSEHFVDIKEGTVADSCNFTRFKILWNNQYLYIFAELKEPHIWTYKVNSSQTISDENNFEIFLDPDNDTHDYFEFELNAQNQLTERYMPMPRRNGGVPLWEWHTRNFRSAVQVYGTINNPSDIDSLWTVEVAIPFKSLSLTDEYIIPQNQDYWKVNFARVEWPTDIRNGMYYKNENGDKGKKKWAWSPQYAGNMHHPEQWGLITFSTHKVGTQTIPHVTPLEEKYSNYLWFLYYKQLLYKKEHLEYAQRLSQLGLAQVWKTKTGEPFLYEMEVKGHIFTLTLTTKRGIKLAINQDGHFQILKSGNQL